MKTVLKYLKPFAVLVLVSVVFLILQAVCDLMLPNVMSNIVNIGIQQGGIAEAVPEEVSGEGMRLITAFMTADDAAYFRNGYSDAGDRLVVASAANDAHAADAYRRASHGLVQFMAQQQTGAAEQEGAVSIDEAQLLALLPAAEAYPAGELAQTYSEGAESAGSGTAAMVTGALYRDLGIDTALKQRLFFLREGGRMLLIALLGVVAAFAVGYSSARVGAGFSRDLRRAVFHKVESFSSREFDKFSTASLITRSTNDVQQVQMFVTMGLRMMCFAPIMGVGGIVMALNKSLSLSRVVALAVVALIIFIIINFSIVLPKFKVRQKLVDDINLISREQLSGMMVIRAFGNEAHEEKRFDEANERLAKVIRYVQRTASTMMPFMSLIMNGATLLIMWVGSKEIAASSLQIGDMMAFVQYAMHIIMSFQMISMMFIFIPQAAVSARRIQEVLTTENSIVDTATPKKLPPRSGGRTVTFQNVCFRYDKAENDLIDNISFEAKPGETTAIIGLTGSGKTTLVNLLPRLYDVTGGSVSIDGVDVRDLSLHDLREEIGYVPQKGLLFSGTVASNVRYGDREASDAEVGEALRVAQAADFVSEMPDGIDSDISQGGTNVSGGQRQRLAIARALARKAPIYIFDDSFSALDYKTDAALRRALEESTDRATVIIVAQRVSTILHADQILVLDGGRVVGKGTHRELLESCEEYRDIAESQLSAAELYGNKETAGKEEN